MIAKHGFTEQLQNNAPEYSAYLEPWACPILWFKLFHLEALFSEGNSATNLNLFITTDKNK